MRSPTLPEKHQITVFLVNLEMEETTRRRISLGPKMAWALIGVLVIVLVLFATWTFLEWSIAEHVYAVKGELDWFGINFYGGSTFLAAALLALVVIIFRQ